MPARERLAPIALGVFVFAAYVFTLHPSVPGGDSGELIAAAYALGVAHPPGYPLFTLLGKLFTLIPLGSIAWRVNLLSAAAMSGASALLFLAVERWSKSMGAALLAAGLFAFSARAWAMATGAEVFALNALFAAALLDLAVRFAENKALREARAAAFLLGLGLSNHHTLIFLGAPLAAWMIWTGRSTLANRRALLQLGALFLAGLLPYAYLPLASATPNASTWGDETTLSGFMRQLSRAEYGTLRLGGEAFSARSSFFEATAAYAGDAAAETFYLGLALAAIGVAGVLKAKKDRRAQRSALIWSLLAYASTLIIFHALANLPLEPPLFRAVLARFWIQPNVLLFAWTGLGWAAIEARLPKPLRLAAPLAAVALALGLRFNANDHRGDDTLHRYAEALARPLPSGAVVLTRGDLITNTLRYAQIAEGLRPDLVILDQELLTFPWMKRLLARTHPELIVPGERYFPGAPGGYDMKTFLGANHARVFLCGGWKAGDSTTAAFATWPIGLCEEILERGHEPSFEAWASSSRTSLPDLRSWPRLSFPDDRWEHYAIRDVYDAFHRHALKALEVAIARNNDRGALQVATSELDELLGFSENLSPAIYKNAGIAYNRMAQHDSSATAKMVAAWRRFVAVADKNDPDLPAVRESLRPYSSP